MIIDAKNYTIYEEVGKNIKTKAKEIASFFKGHALGEFEATGWIYDRHSIMDDIFHLTIKSYIGGGDYYYEYLQWPLDDFLTEEPKALAQVIFDGIQHDKDAEAAKQAEEDRRNAEASEKWQEENDKKEYVRLKEKYKNA